MLVVWCVAGQGGGEGIVRGARLLKTVVGRHRVANRRSTRDDGGFAAYVKISSN